jgi:hypothetical protein
MNTTKEEVKIEQPKGEEREIIHRVMDQLGTPKNLFRTVAKKVWDNQYRVNVYCTDETGQPLKTVSITDSFFVTLSGTELVSKPTITRKYG